MLLEEVDGIASASDGGWNGSEQTRRARRVGDEIQRFVSREILDDRIEQFRQAIREQLKRVDGE